MKYVAVIVPLLIVWIAAICVVNGWAISILWGWFLVPLGIPAISVPQAIGIAILTAMLFYHKNPTDNSDDEHKGAKFAGEIIGYTCRPFFALLAGLIVKQFM